MKRRTSILFLLLILTLSVLTSCAKKPTTKQGFVLKLGSLLATGATPSGGVFVQGISDTGTVLVKLDSNLSAEFLPGVWTFNIVGYEGPSAYAGAVYCGGVSGVTIGGASADVSLDITTANCAKDPFLSLRRLVDDKYKYPNGLTISSITPAFGARNGGTPIKISGSGFYDGITLKVGAQACASIQVVDSSTITCTTAAQPLASAFIADVIVTNTDTRTFTKTSAFEFVPAPMATSISPTAGPLAGLTTVTIKGANFKPGARVFFGAAKECTLPVVVDAGTITCSTPAMTAGAASIVVTNSDGQSSSTTGLSYNYQAAPTIGILPKMYAYLVGGNKISIAGTGFLSGLVIKLGPVACTTSTLITSTLIECITPPRTTAGDVAITVTNSDGQVATASTLVTYQGAPTITGVAPQIAYITGGNVLTISGSNFFSGITVKVGTGACTNVSVLNANSLTCKAPVQPIGTASIDVTNTDLQKATLANAITYPGPPTLSSVMPFALAASQSTLITVTGSGFLSGATVSVGGSNCTNVTYVNDTKLTCLAPPLTAGLSDLKVFNPDTQTVTLTGAIVYQLPPTISTTGAISPAIVSTIGGMSINISGTNFFPSAQVKIGTLNCINVNVVSPTSISCVVPAQGAGTYSITVTNTDKQSVTATTAIIYKVAPTVIAASPGAGVVAGGTNLTITGTGFFTGITFLVNGVNCANITVASTTSATCTTGAANSSGTGDVVVRNLDPLEGRLTGGFTYINSLSPTQISSLNAYDVNGILIPDNATLVKGQVIKLVLVASDANSLPIEYKFMKGALEICPWKKGIDTCFYTVDATDLGLKNVKISGFVRNSDGYIYSGSPLVGDDVKYFNFSAPDIFKPSQIINYGAKDAQGLPILTTPISASAGQKITLQIQATDLNVPSLPIQYKFSKGPMILCDWNLSNTCTYTVSTFDEGLMDVAITGSVRNNDMVDYTSDPLLGDDSKSINFAISTTLTPATINILNAYLNGATLIPGGSLVNVGDIIKLELIASDLKGLGIQYRFLKGNTVLCDWGTLNTCNYVVSPDDLGIKSVTLTGAVRNTDGVNFSLDPAIGDEGRSWSFIAQ